MRRLTTVLAAIVACGVAVPASAQDGTLSIAAFMTVRDENVAGLEEGIRQHNQWHQQQGDPWTWQVWQAMTGPPEYVYISSGHSWSDLDAPGIDLSQDHINWAETGGQSTETLNAVIWETLVDGSLPPDSSNQPTIVQVFEFVMNPGGDEAFAHVLAKYREAAEAVAPNDRYTWDAVVSGPEGTTHFVVAPATSFAEFGMDSPEPPEVLARHYGMTEARAILDAFAGAMTFKASRMWVLRPDLSFGSN